MASKAIDQILAITEPNRAASGAAIPAANFDAALAAAVDDQQHAPTPPELETLESAEKHASDTEGSADVDARGTADKDRPADPDPEQETSEQSEDTVRGEQEQPQDEVELSLALAAYAAEEQKPDTAAQPAVGESGDLQAADDADASAGAESDSRTGVTAARGAQDVEISETQQVSPPVDANETSIEEIVLGMEKYDCDHGERPQSIDIWPIYKLH